MYKHEDLQNSRTPDFKIHRAEGAPQEIFHKISRVSGNFRKLNLAFSAEKVNNSRF